MTVTQTGYPTTSSGTAPQQPVNGHMLPNAEQHEQLASGRITAVLGEGGSAIVYQVWNELLSVKRAVKLLKPTASAESHQRFSQEMKILAQLSHTNIINVHSVGKWQNLPYIEMDYVDGPSLETLLERKGRIPLVVAIAIAVEVARALDYTHHHRYRIDNIEYHGLLHRDLKPGNILLPRFDTVRLSDFGIATLSTVSKTNTTQTGKIIGSMQYLAPEQLEENSVDHRSDIYSFGVMLYEMVTGHKMFPERNVSKLVRQRVKDEYLSLNSHGVKIPTDLSKLINSMTSLKPTDRPTSMKKVLTQLQHIFRHFHERSPEEIISRYLNGESVGSSIRRKPKREHNPMKLIFIGGVSAVLLMVAMFAGGIFWYGSQNNPAFLDEIQGVFAANTDDSSSEAIQVNVIVNKMTDTTTSTRNNSSRESQPRNNRRTNNIPSTLPQTGDYAGDTLSMLDLCLKNFGTKDTIFALKELEKSQKYSQIIALYSDLTPQMKQDKIAQLMRHRAIRGLGQEGKTYYDNNQISDGEYYLSKGLYLFSRGQYQRAIWIFRVAKTTPSALINRDELMQEVLFYSAQSESQLYESHPTEQRLKSTLNSWNELIELLKDQPENPIYHTAVAKIEEISEVIE